jgi:integrase
MSIKLREKPLADGRRSLYLDFYQDGHRRYEFLNLYLTKDTALNKETRRLAEKILGQRMADEDAERHGFTPPSRRSAEFISFFDKATSIRRGSTAQVWKSVRVHLVAYGGENLRFSEMTKKWVQGFRDYLLNDCELSQNTARHYFEKVKTALNEAVNEGIITRNPFKGVKNIEVREAEREYLVLDELKALAATQCDNETVKRAFFFSVYTGLRKSDVMAIERVDIHRDRLSLRQEKTEDIIYIDLSPSALAWLGELPEAGPVFPLPNGWTLSKTIARWVSAAKITKHITFHCARHTFATLALTHGVDLYTVSKLLGHKDVSTTQVYAKIVDEKKRAAVHALPSVTE